VCVILSFCVCFPPKVCHFSSQKCITNLLPYMVLFISPLARRLQEMLAELASQPRTKDFRPAPTVSRVKPGGIFFMAPVHICFGQHFRSAPSLTPSFSIQFSSSAACVLVQTDPGERCFFVNIPWCALSPPWARPNAAH
jgi:hypothetical protein